MKHAPRVVAEHPSGAARHGGNATSPPCAPHVPPPSPTTQNTEGGGVWGEHLRWAAPRESVALCLGTYRLRACTDLHLIGPWARRVRPGGLFGPPSWYLESACSSVTGVWPRVPSAHLDYISRAALSLSLSVSLPLSFSLSFSSI